MSTLLKDLKKASVAAIDEISCQPFYGQYAGIHCGWSAEVLKQKLVDLGYDSDEIWVAPEAAIHQWLAIDDLVVDIWELEGQFKLKYWRYTDPKMRRSRLYHWPGRLSGVRPVDVDRFFSKEEISWYYHHYWEPKKLPKGLR